MFSDWERCLKKKKRNRVFRRLVTVIKLLKIWNLVFHYFFYHLTRLMKNLNPKLWDSTPMTLSSASPISSFWTANSLLKRAQVFLRAAPKSDILLNFRYSQNMWVARNLFKLLSVKKLTFSNKHICKKKNFPYLRVTFISTKKAMSGEMVFSFR